MIAERAARRPTSPPRMSLLDSRPTGTDEHPVRKTARERASQYGVRLDWRGDPR